MIRTAFSRQAVLRKLPAFALQKFLQGALAVRLGNPVAVLRYLQEYRLLQQIARRFEPAIQIDSSHYRLEGIRQQRGFIPPASLFFSATQPQVFAQAQRARSN